MSQGASHELTHFIRDKWVRGQVPDSKNFLEKFAKHLLTCGVLSCIIKKSDFDRSVFARLFCEKRTCENIRYYCLFSRRCRKWFVRREDGLRREAVPEELIGSLRRPISLSALSVMSSNFRIQYAVLAVTIRVARSLRWVRIDFLRLLILKLKGCPDCLSLQVYRRTACRRRASRQFFSC